MQIEHNHIPIPGLEKPLRLFHITDSHLALAGEEESAYIHDIAVERTGCFQPADGRTAVSLLEEALDIARDMESDWVIFTGDIIDYPSRANLDILRKTLQTMPHSFYIVGNHDWCFPIYPVPEEERQLHLAEIGRVTGQPTDFTVQDLGGVLLVGLDDSLYQVTENQVTRMREVLDRGLPVILCLHIPIYADTLREDTDRTWGAPILLGSPEETLVGKSFGCNNLHASESTRAFIQMVESADNVAAVITGHLHFMHEDLLAGWIPQFVTRDTPKAGVRVIDLVPAQAE